jgi:hypothetical protein
LDPVPATRPVPISPLLGRYLDAARLAGRPVILRGPHGIGKSEFMADYAMERGLSYLTLDLSVLEPADLTGIPWVDREAALTRYAPPATLPPHQGEGAWTLVLEELNRCDRSLRQPCLQLLSTRRINTYQLPPACFLVACVNPDDGYDVDPIDPALASRFLWIDVVPDREAWLAWATRKALDDRIIELIRKERDAFGRATPRAWEQVALLVAAARRMEGWTSDQAQRLIEFAVGPILARAVMLYLGDSLPMVLDPALLYRDPEEYLRFFDRWERARQVASMKLALDALDEHLRAHGLPTGEALQQLELIAGLVAPDLTAKVRATIEALKAGGDESGGGKGKGKRRRRP